MIAVHFDVRDVTPLSPLQRKDDHVFCVHTSFGSSRIDACDCERQEWPKLKPATVTPQPIDDNAPLKPGQMKVDTLEGPTRVKVNSDGNTTINMGVRGSFTQKIDMQTKTLHIESSAVTMAGFADMLTRVMQMGDESNRQVVDMTGVTGYYQVNLEIPLAEVLAMMRARGRNMPVSAGSAASGAAPDTSEADDGVAVLEWCRRWGSNWKHAKQAWHGLWWTA